MIVDFVIERLSVLHHRGALENLSNFVRYNLQHSALKKLTNLGSFYGTSSSINIEQKW